MISGCGFPNFKNNFENMIGQFINMFGEENSTIIAVTESPMFNAKEAEIVTIIVSLLLNEVNKKI